MLELESRLATGDELRFDRDVVAETRRLAKTRARLHHRVPGEIVCPEIRNLVHAQRAFDERGRAGIENLEIARIEDDPGGIAVAPLDARCADVAEHVGARLSGRHAQSGVEPHHRAIEVAVLDHMVRERGELRRIAQLFREGQGGRKAVLSLLG
jgi:hypothetical protein